MSNLKQRNYAVLLALVVLGGVIFAITLIRLSEGTAQRLELEKNRAAETAPVAP